ncbi:MAG: geranylgeranyl reductase family protein [Firmicutes bacterium]|nr:geranylgeranyl reductase family protein [Bacillota bacterium]
MTSYDCIVIGTGPAGSMALARLGKAGVRALGLEKAFFPRRKTCAGALSGAAISLLPLGFQHLVRQKTVQVDVHCLPGGLVRSFQFTEPIAHLIDRDQFDGFLQQQARDAGAIIREGERVMAVETCLDGAIVHSSGGSYRSQVVIGADGAHSIVARSQGLRPPVSGLGLEVELDLSPRLQREFAGRIIIHYGEPPNGYSWAFGKGDHASFGVALLQSRPPDPRPYLERFLKRLDLPFPQNIPWRGHPIPLGGKNHPVSAHRIILAGDAAGLTDPFTGEGIAYALESGRLAAAHALGALQTGDFAFTEYSQEVQARIVSQLEIARKMAKIFYLMPSLTSYCLEHQSWLVERYFQMVRGDLDYAMLLGEIRGHLSVPNLPEKQNQPRTRQLQDIPKAGPAYLQQNHKSQDKG